MILPVAVSGNSSTNTTFARRLIPGEAPPDIGADFFGEFWSRRDIRFRHDEGAHDFAAHRVGMADCRCHQHGRMLHQAILDVGRADAVAAARDQIVLAALVPDVARVILQRDVAGQQPTASKSRRCRRRIIPVAEKHDRVRPLNRDDAGLAGRQHLARPRHNRDPVSRDRPAHRAWPHRVKRTTVADQQIGLGLAVELVDPDPERLIRPGEDILAERLAATRHRAQIEAEALARR